MNYLAHLYLASDDGESMVGNLAGDFVKGPIHGHDAISRGIRQHRAIDAFTDTHPAVAAFRRVLIPDHGHYARVISDVFFDYFLAIDFPEPLDAFLDRAFAMMDPHPKPARLGAAYPYMKQWMLSYRDVDGIRMALRGISRRLSRHPDLETAVQHLIDSRVELERRFRDFFPDVVAFARDEKRSGNVRA